MPAVQETLLQQAINPVEHQVEASDTIKFTMKANLKPKNPSVISLATTLTALRNNYCCWIKPTNAQIDLGVADPAPNFPTAVAVYFQTTICVHQLQATN